MSCRLTPIALLPGMLSAVLAEEIDFNRDIRPILSDRCYHCHGPDAQNQKSELRLDTREHATAEIGGLRGITPGSLEESEVHRFSLWMTGGGIKPGMTHGATDNYRYNVTEKPVHVHDLHATLLHQLGIDHEKLTYFFQGRHFRLTDVHGHLVKEILA